MAQVLRGFVTLRHLVPGERPLLRPTPGPVGSSAANGPPFPLPPPSAGRPPSASPCPSRLNPGLPDIPSAPKSRFPDSAPGPLPLCVLHTATLRVRYRRGSAGTPFPARFPSSVPGAHGAVWGDGRVPSPGLPHPVPLLGPCPNPKRRRARGRQRGARAPRTRSPPFMPPPSRGQGWSLLLSPRSASRCRPGGELCTAALCRLARKDSWVQTCESPQGHPLINDDVLAHSPAANLPPRNEICPL